MVVDACKVWGNDSFWQFEGGLVALNAVQSIS